MRDRRRRNLATERGHPRVRRSRAPDHGRSSGELGVPRLRSGTRQPPRRRCGVRSPLRVLDPLRTNSTSKSGDVALKGASCTLGRLVVPHVVDQDVCGDDTVRVDSRCASTARCLGPPRGRSLPMSSETSTGPRTLNLTAKPPYVCCPTFGRACWRPVRSIQRSCCPVSRQDFKLYASDAQPVLKRDHGCSLRRE
jgi:hypothetical protein